jgi:putative membrane protein
VTDDRFGRFPRSVYSVGAEPDPRFSLANERTYLAWIRTSLALMAAGVALQVFDIGGGSVPSVVASVMLIVSSIGVPLHAWWGWARTEKSMRMSEALPSPRIALPLAVVLAAVGVLVLWSVLR